MEKEKQASASESHRFDSEGVVIDAPERLPLNYWFSFNVTFVCSPLSIFTKESHFQYKYDI